MDEGGILSMSWRSLIGGQLIRHRHLQALGKFPVFQQRRTEFYVSEAENPMLCGVDGILVASAEFQNLPVLVRTAGVEDESAYVVQQSGHE